MELNERPWTKFKDQLPEEYEPIFVTDWSKVWAIGYQNKEQIARDAAYFPDHAWSYIEMPPVPSKK